MSKYAKYKIQSTQQELPTSKYAKYKITPKGEEESPSFLNRIGQFAKGALSGFGRSAMEEAASQAEHGVMDVGGFAAPLSVATAKANIPGKGIESLESMRPKAKDSLGNILYHAGEFGGGVAGFPMLPGRAAGAQGIKSLLSRFGKDVGTGASIGAGSGVLQEGGVNPLVADIGTTLALPLGGAGITTASKGTKNLLSKFTPKGRAANINTEVGNILKQRIGEQNIPSVLSKLEAQGPLGTNLTTAELAENAGLAGLHRALAPNIPAIAEKNIANNLLINKKLESLGNLELAPVAAGENIRGRLATNLGKAVKTRAEVSSPLFEKIEELKTGVEPTNILTFLDKKSKYAKGEIKKELDEVRKLITSNTSPQINMKKFNKEYGNLSAAARSQLLKEMTGNPLPAELYNAGKSIDDMISTAQKSDKNELAKILTEAKKHLVTDMASIPEIEVARSTYAALSPPVNAIENEPLLKKFIKQNQYSKEYTLSPEKIPEFVLSGTIDNTKALVNQISKDKRTLNTVRGTFINKLLSDSKLSNAEQSLSYDKVKKFLNTNKSKLGLIFEPEQVKVLEDTREILRRRNMVQTLGRAAGSNTQSETTLLNDLLGTSANKILREGSAYNIPGGGFIYDAVKKVFKDSQAQATKELLERALLDPKTAKLLLTPTNKIKDANTLNNILEQIYPGNVATSLTSNRKRKENDGL